tara:strand:- start:1717 stop:2034 length:318 start_codon:yes stop_codon:yes gene_type:complete
MTELNKLIEISKSDFNLAIVMLGGSDVKVVDFVKKCYNNDNFINVPGFWIIPLFRNGFRVMMFPSKYFPQSITHDDIVFKSDLINYMTTYLTAVIKNKTKLKDEN